MSKKAVNLVVIKRVEKKTSQASRRAKTSSMNKHLRKSYKAYRGQGR